MQTDGCDEASAVVTSHDCSAHISVKLEIKLEADFKSSDFLE